MKRLIINGVIGFNDFIANPMTIQNWGTGYSKLGLRVRDCSINYNNATIHPYLRILLDTNPDNNRGPGMAAQNDSFVIPTTGNTNNFKTDVPSAFMWFDSAPTAIQLSWYGKSGSLLDINLMEGFLTLEIILIP